jgi:hypothetical protein
MAGDKIGFFYGQIQYFRRPGGNVFVGGAMESKSTNAVFTVVFKGDTVEVGRFRHGGVEGGIKNSDHGNLGKQGPAGPVTQEGGGIVKRGELGVFFHHRFYLGGHQLGLFYAFPSMNKSVAHSVYLFKILYDSLFRIRKKGKQIVDSRNVVGKIVVHIQPGALTPFIVKHASRAAHPFNQALTDPGRPVHVVKLVLYRRTAAVYYQYFHAKHSIR